VSQTRDLPADVPALIRELLGTDAGRPRVTWYGPSGERVEFSTKTLNNWISKTSNLLVDELDVGPASRLGIALPVHWRSVVWLLAAWSVGAHAVVLRNPEGPKAVVPAGAAVPVVPLDVLVTDRPSSPPLGTEESLLVVVTLPALATRFMGDVPNGAVDAAAEVRLQPDAFVVTDRPLPTDPAFTANGPTVPYGELLDTARLAGYPEGVRLLTSAAPERAIEMYLAALAAGGSMVLHHDLGALSRVERDHLVSQEAVNLVDP
jgi:uncharacterized protein (TIGR03089 family)